MDGLIAEFTANDIAVSAKGAAHRDMGYLHTHLEPFPAFENAPQTAPYPTAPREGAMSPSEPQIPKILRESHAPGEVAHDSPLASPAGDEEEWSAWVNGSEEAEEDDALGPDVQGEKQSCSTSLPCCTSERGR